VMLNPEGTGVRPVRTIDLGSVSVDLLQIGAFRSDAGAIFGPVPRTTWEPLVRDEIDAEVVATERRIAEETARNEGKPEAALTKIVEGRVNGFFKENVLLEQDFAKDNKLSVAKVLENAGITVSAFARMRVGA